MQKVALVTGAAGGLGRQVANKLSADGWNLIVVSRHATHLSDAFGERFLHIESDCSTVAGARLIFQIAKDKGMIPTALAHCVGNIRLGALHRMTEADFNECLSANLVSAFHTLAAFVGALRDARSEGAAVLVSSVAAQIGTPNHEAIAAAFGGGDCFGALENRHEVLARFRTRRDRPCGDLLDDVGGILEAGVFVREDAEVSKSRGNSAL